MRTASWSSTTRIFGRRAAEAEGTGLSQNLQDPSRAIVGGVKASSAKDADQHPPPFRGAFHLLGLFDRLQEFGRFKPEIALPSFALRLRRSDVPIVAPLAFTAQEARAVSERGDLGGAKLVQKFGDVRMDRQGKALGSHVSLVATTL